MTDRARATGRIGAVIFDFGGVLTNPLDDIFEAFCCSKGIPADSIRRAVADSADLRAASLAFEVGAMAEQDFMNCMASALGLPGPVDPDELFAALEIDREMLATVGWLRSRGVKTVLLSNSWGQTPYPQMVLNGVFDNVFISEQLGMRKPDLPIYEHVLGVVEVVPERCAMVDDTIENLVSAEHVGMIAIHHVSARGTLDALRNLSSGSRAFPSSQ